MDIEDDDHMDLEHENSEEGKLLPICCVLKFQFRSQRQYKLQGLRWH